MMNMIEEIRSTAKGVQILESWLGAGGAPVADELADKRANVCIECPLNVEPNWWGRVKNAIASAIKDHLRVKSNLGFRVENEDGLSMCKVCGCCNALAVWTPIEHIKSHTSTEQFVKFPTACWKRNEIGKL